MQNLKHKQLIIGAGFVGLGIAQALKEAKIPYDQVDGSDNIGGNWYHGVYETAHIISSKKVTQFSQFPMPDHYPDFPSAKQMWDYLKSFANHYQLETNIELNKKVISVNPIENNLWQVTFDNQERRIYKGIIMCNGHHWCKRLPDFKGEFSGKIIHSKDYKQPNQLRGKKVLVIGGGNSACDIAAEAARVGEKSVLSLRESIWFIPKTFMGIPSVDLIQGWMTQWLQRWLAYGIILLTFGKHESYGLATPNYRIFAKHPTLNNEVPYYIKHGRILPKPAVSHLDKQWVEFVDGSREQFDLIVCATGYHVTYPFLPSYLQRVKGSLVECYGGSFLEDYNGLAFIGWGQARGGVGSVISAYAPLFARLLQLQDQINVPLGLVFKEIGQSLPKTHLSDPHQIFRKLKLLKWGFSLLERKAYQVDKAYPNFKNNISSSSTNIKAMNSAV
ncbi:MAG: flavin-containing monooxygenase [Microcystaceae cyanobacterium]